MKERSNALQCDRLAEKDLLEWLDELVYYTLNPDGGVVGTISRREEESICNRIKAESLKVHAVIQKHLMSSQTKEEAELLITNYHLMLYGFLDQSFLNLKKLTRKKGSVYNILILMIRHIEELLSRIESNFSLYLSMDEYVPRGYFHRVQKELSFRIRKIRLKALQSDQQKKPFEIFLRKMDRFLNAAEFESTTSYRKIFYKKKLISEIEKMDTVQLQLHGFTLLDATLIYLNFNSREYINYLLQYVEKRLESAETPDEREKELQYLYKSFKQLPKCYNIAYNHNFQSVDILLNNWFRHELTYLRSIKEINSSSEKLGTDTGHVAKPLNGKQKIVCMLSSDQIGLILRSADDQKILIAPSMSRVFKAIVPNLSTPSRENLSYDGMRSKSYVAEERDKKLAIEALERIIDKIREY